WGDAYGNRVDRFLACVAYLDGKRPSLVMCRGYYTRSVLAAWDWRDGKLTQRWVFDTHDGTPGNLAYAGQGNHNLSVGDVDGDGRDEIVYGSMCVDDNGKGLWNTGFGHGDAIHLSDLDPEHPGLEVFDIHEHVLGDVGIDLRDAKTGKPLWTKPSPDVGRGVAFDIDPRHPGHEVWAAGPGLNALYDCQGNDIGPKPRSCNMAVWWDGDFLRELLSGTTIAKWDFENGREVPMLSAGDYDCLSNNSTKANPCLCADILGDWREEVIWRARNGCELRIFTTTIPTTHRLPTLMHDPLYRLGIAWQNVGYNQPAHTSYFLGDGMKPPPRSGGFPTTDPSTPQSGKHPGTGNHRSLKTNRLRMARNVVLWRRKFVAPWGVGGLLVVFLRDIPRSLSGSLKSDTGNSRSRFVCRNKKHNNMGNKLYVGNLSFDTTENDLQDLFAGAGAVTEAALVQDKMTGNSRGFGFVTMSSDAEAQAAISQFHGKDFHGRNLTVNEARPREDFSAGGPRKSYGGGGRRY
ncbi:MAG: hypothetical protein ABIZ56_07640, partial [Chthoniobacteraceae bacterium]